MKARTNLGEERKTPTGDHGLSGSLLSVKNLSRVELEERKNVTWKKKKTVPDAVVYPSFFLSSTSLSFICCGCSHACTRFFCGLRGTWEREDIHERGFVSFRLVSLRLSVYFSVLVERTSTRGSSSFRLVSLRLSVSFSLVLWSHF